MRAVVAHEYGAPEVLKIEQVPRPEPNDDEALVRVIASSVNPADPLTLSGKYAKEFGTHLPLIPGYDIAGVVEKTGANVTKLKVGDAVYGYPTFGGGWADYVAIKEWEVAAKPKSLSFAEAAAVPMGALTAWQALVDVAKLQPGQTILIHGGSGGVGSFAVQIAKARGARVMATASRANRSSSLRCARAKWCSWTAISAPTLPIRWLALLPRSAPNFFGGLSTSSIPSTACLVRT